MISLTQRFILSSLSTILSLAFLFSCGDVSPDPVEVSDIPAYYLENDYLDDRVEAINYALKECSDYSESFFWITDMHWEPELNTRNSPLLIKYISSKTGIDRVLNGGDTGNSQVICKNAIAQLIDAIGSQRVYTVTGNHEMYDASRYENPFERVADELRGHNSDIVYGDSNRSYFYFDREESKTRFIGLSSFGLYHNKEYEPGYTIEQLVWFKNIALNVDTGWTIIIFTHALYCTGVASDKLLVAPSGGNAFVEAIDQYDGNGIISCVLMGHAHKDRLHIGTSGVPYIVSASDRYVPYEGDLDVERNPGTISEQHFEVVIVDKGRRTVRLFSIGSNARNGYDNDPGEEVIIRTVNF